LHGVLLVAQGLTCPEVAALLGDGSRSVEYWVRGFEETGLAGLQEGERPGRPPRLSPQQRGEVDAVLRKAPREVRHGWQSMGRQDPGRMDRTTVWSRLGVRQGQRVFRPLGFRLRKPRPVVAPADPQRQKAHKKNSRR